MAALLAATALTACTDEKAPAEVDWPTQIVNPDAFAFRVVVGMTDGAPREGTPGDGEATTLDQVWEKVGDEAREAAEALTAPVPAGTDETAFKPFATLTPAEVQLLPAEIAFNVPYVHCGQLLELPREFPDPATETVLCDTADAKYRLRPVAINATGLRNATVDSDTLNGGWKIILDFTGDGSATWAELTGANVNNQVAMVLGDEVLSAPTIMSAITAGTTEISGRFTQTEARELVSRINDALTN